jgi:hypothetical protein
MQSPIPPKEDGMSESEVASVVLDFTQKLRDRRFEELWIPTDMVHDSESDDQLAWLLLRYVHDCKGSSDTLRVLVQLPTPKSDFPELEDFDERFQTLGCETFRDPSSRNAKAIKHAWHGT